IVNREDDLVASGFGGRHRVREHVAAHRLDDILGDLSAVRLDSLPAPRVLADAHVTQLARLRVHARLPVAQLAAGRQADAQPLARAGELAAADRVDLARVQNRRAERLLVVLPQAGMLTRLVAVPALR